MKAGLETFRLTCHVMQVDLSSNRFLGEVTPKTAVLVHLSGTELQRLIRMCFDRRSFEDLWKIFYLLYQEVSRSYVYHFF